MPRNVFENNEAEEEVGLVLPPLADGYHYEFNRLPDGKTQVTVEEDVDSEKEEVRLALLEPRDQFGRHKL